MVPSPPKNQGGGLFFGKFLFRGGGMQNFLFLGGGAPV